MSKQTAAKFGLHAGSKFEMTGPESAPTGQVVKVNVVVTGIVAPTDPTSNFWTADPTIVAPGLQGPTDDPILGGRGHGRAGRDPGARALLRHRQPPAGVGVPARR